MPQLWPWLKRVLRHRWYDRRDARRAVNAAACERLERRIAASEQRHSGQVRICVEAALPTSYLWRGASARERAVAIFGKLQVWDTEHNNGVLIYLLLADHAIELVADRGLNRHVAPAQWQAMVAHLSKAVRAGSLEDGLTTALEEASAVLVQHFPLPSGALRENSLPDHIDLR